MSSQEMWDARFIGLADLVATWSKDRSTRVGCVIVGTAHQVLATGCNGFPRGVNDDIEDRHERPAKYQWTEHAERNALYNAARTGVPVEGATLYVSFSPCADCARGIIQSGVAAVVVGNGTPDFGVGDWNESCRIAERMFGEASVTTRFYYP